MTFDNSRANGYGWRARIGLILPADNVLMEPELYSLEIPGVSFHVLRLTATEHEAMRQQAVDLANTVRELGLDVIAYACAETSFNSADGTSESLAEAIEQNSGVPVVTATTALLAALEFSGSRNLTLTTPYGPTSATILENLLDEHGYQILASVHRDFSLDSADKRVWYHTNRQPASVAYTLAKSITTSGADTIVIASTNWATIQAIELLERDTGQRVLTSNQCILWWIFRKLQICEEDLGVGELLRSGRAVQQDSSLQVPA